MRQCIECKKQYYKDNSERELARVKRYSATYKRDPKKTSATYKRYRLKNLAKRNEQYKRWAAAKSNQTPVWVDADQIWMMREAYSLAQMRENITGGKWHVDHFIQLNGGIVSGLHVIENLRVIPMSLNVSKGNKLIGDAPKSFF